MPETLTCKSILQLKSTIENIDWGTVMKPVTITLKRSMII